MTAYFEKQEEKEINRRIAADIRRYGKDIIGSDIFRRSFCQKHHTNMTVGEHTLNVTASALRICYRLQKAGLEPDLGAVTVGALCHDLGILGRDHKFQSTIACWKLHPADSVKVTKQLVPGLDKKTEEIIRRHMWPLTPAIPDSLEACILVAADKYSSMRELFYRPGMPLLRHETAGMIVYALIGGSAA